MERVALCAAVACAALVTECNAAGPWTPAHYVVMRFRGQPDIDLSDPRGNLLRVVAGHTMQNGGVSARVLPSENVGRRRGKKVLGTCIYLMQPETGVWRLAAAVDDGETLDLNVTRLSERSAEPCDMSETVKMRGEGAQWWWLEWSAAEADSCWVRIVRHGGAAARDSVR